MGAARERKARQAAKDAREAATVAEEAGRETFNLLHRAYRDMRRMQDTILWYTSCIEEYRRLRANGQITEHF